jgi:putative FmdB family regulatory protein
MPTYEYECQRCGHVFERFQSMTAEPIKRCPECRGKVKRLIGAGAGIIFKGSGFYETDYRSEDYKRKAKAEKTPPATSDTKKESASKGKNKSKKVA